MKVDLIRKFRWYIIGFILVAIMLSVSLSFASWDTTSLKAKLSQGSSGAYNDMVKLVEDKFMSDGTQGGNGIVDIGDILSFGNYYQVDANTKTPIRWIVVEKKTGTSGEQELTLLAEKVLAFGSFWGNYYHNGSSWVYATQANGSYYQNYSKSTVRAWLNSYYTGSDARNDAGTAFSANNSAVVFRGFMNEAFTKDEQDYIISKTMSGMNGYGKDNNPSTQTEPYATITDKVWLPSWSEVYGTTATSWGTTIDGSPSARFSYFSGTIYNPTSEESKKEPNKTLIGKTTAFASSAASNYTYSSISHSENWQGGNVWWWLRSPSPATYRGVLVVGSGGSGSSGGTCDSRGGVRPAVIVPM